MKKFCFSLICLVVLLFVGFSTYYIVRNDENITYSIADHDTIYMNLGEVIFSPVVHQHANPNTKIEITLSNTNVSYDANLNTFSASKAGSTTITCVPSNTNFRSISFTIKVGDGTAVNPYYLRTEKDLQSIGKGSFLLSANYELVNDIVLTENFTPIGDSKTAFTGTLFGGESMYTISNINIDSKGIAGFFGNLGATSKVERVIFEHVNIFGDYEYAGAIAAINSGFVGQCIVKDCSIINSSETGVTGAVVGTNKSLASSAQVSLCTVNANISSRNYLGGVVGKNEGGTIDNCHVTVDVALMDTKAIFGGLVGFNTYTKTMLKDSEMYINAKIYNNLVVLNNIGQMGNYYTIVGKTVSLSSPFALSYFETNISCAPADVLPMGENSNDKNFSSSLDSATNYYANVSSQELEDKATFTAAEGSTWDFEQLWSLQTGKIAIDYVLCAGSYQETPDKATVKSQLTTQSQVVDALNLMREFPSVNLQFEVTKNLVVDFHEENLSPIGNVTTPFVGKLVATDGVNLIIRNFNINSDEDYVGFFGVISGNDTILRGIKFSGAKYYGKNIGGIAGFNNGAKIEYCTVNNVEFNATGFAGGLVGLNKGEMVGDVEEETLFNSKFNVDQISESELGIGMLVAVNEGKVASMVANMCSVDFYKVVDKTIVIGGIVAKQNSGNVSDCANYNITINGKNYGGRGYIYLGGLVGMLEGGTVQSCYVIAFNGELASENELSYAGGIAGFINSGGSIESCLFNSGSLNAFYSGGVAAILHGSINASAVDINGSISGAITAGIVADCFGQVTNSYSLALLTGSKVQAGFVGYLNHGAIVRYCYNYCSYNGMGEAYCESATPFRSQKGDWQFLNNIVVGQKVGGGGLLGDTFVTSCTQRGEKEVAIQHKNWNKGTFTIVSEDVAKGSSQFVEFVNNGFSSNIWYTNVDIGEGDAQFLTLKSLPKIPTDESEEVPEESENIA